MKKEILLMAILLCSSTPLLCMKPFLKKIGNVTKNKKLLSQSQVALKYKLQHLLKENKKYEEEKTKNIWFGLALTVAGPITVGASVGIDLVADVLIDLINPPYEIECLPIKVPVG